MFFVCVKSFKRYVSEFCKLDRLGKPVDNARLRLLDEREQALAMREAELAKQAFEQSRVFKNQTEAQLAELHAKEQGIAKERKLFLMLTFCLLQRWLRLISNCLSWRRNKGRSWRRHSLCKKKLI